jgi:type VI secretion system protein ImpL
MVFVELLNRPFDCLWSGVCRQASVALQKNWDEMVLTEVEGVYDEGLLLDTMFGSRGKAVAFVNGLAAPFIARDRAKGFYAKEIEGTGILFDDDFLQYLTRGSYSFKSEAQEFEVKMDGVPTDVNQDAAWIPSATKVTLQCAEGAQCLENYNFPVSQTFTWSPSDDGTVVLQIYIEDVILEKQYSGFRPFAQFVRDFSNGSHKFCPDDFPEQQHFLERMGIEFIDVKYRIQGAKPVVELLDMEAGAVPEVIVTCFS